MTITVDVKHSNCGKLVVLYCTIPHDSHIFGPKRTSPAPGRPLALAQFTKWAPTYAAWWSRYATWHLDSSAGGFFGKNGGFVQGLQGDFSSFFWWNGGFRISQPLFRFSMGNQQQIQGTSLSMMVMGWRMSRISDLNWEICGWPRTKMVDLLAVLPQYNWLGKTW